MESSPSRAKRRISSSPSHGFIVRFRRSTFCALVSLAVVVIKKTVRKTKNPPPDATGDGSVSADIKKESLGQQPPRASAHACTTTTSAAAHSAKIAVLWHSSLDSRLNRFRRQ